METAFNDFQNSKKNHQILFSNKNFQSIFDNFRFFLIDDENQYTKDILLIQNKRKIIIIDEREFMGQNYFIVCFEETIMIICANNLDQMKIFFNKNKDSDIFALDKSSFNTFSSQITDNQSIFNFSIIDQTFTSEITTLLRSFKVTNNSNIWNLIRRSLSGYLIKKAYQNSYDDRVQNCQQLFIKKLEQIHLSKDDFIVMRNIYSTASSSLALVYQIPLQKFFVVKKVLTSLDSKLNTREYNNYLNVHHPFLLKCYDSPDLKTKNALILEYIEGSTLEDIKMMKLEMNDKMKIIFEIMLVIEYLHNNGYIYRDLKPNNVMLNKDKTIVLIDLDRMIKRVDLFDENESTVLFHQYAAPEIANGLNFSYPVDIYSIGALMYYIIFEEHFSSSIDLQQQSSGIFSLIKQCIDSDPSKRPSISKLIDTFYFYFFSKISKEIDEIDSIKITIDVHSNKFTLYWLFLAEYKHPFSLYLLGKMYDVSNYFKRDINKVIHYYTLSADKNNANAQFYLGLIYDNMHNGEKAVHYYTLAADNNDPYAQFNLGSIYAKGKYCKKDIEKTIHYWKLAADQNDLKSLFNLGLLYYEDKLIQRDINKAIHYFQRAADFNYSFAQCRLGMIYMEGKHVTRDVNKALYYYQLASGQNNADAHHQLGMIYLKGEYVKTDINKAIKYLQLSAQYNNVNSLFTLGLIYDKGQFISRDVNKAIHYYELAASLSDSSAQYNLGLIYNNSESFLFDINKAIYYYTLAANQNYLDAQYNLASIYYNGAFVARDINKAINYFTLAADQYHLESQFALGLIYYKGEFIKRDVNKTLHYWSLAASQYHSDSQTNLGIIYYKGEFVPRDINKAIYYWSLAAKQNNSCAQFNLGLIYSENKYVKQDMSKAIYYYTLAADQCHSYAQYNLGIIYYNGEFVTRDINKAIHYLSLAAEQNNSEAQYKLGLIYKEGKYVKQDIDKAIHYYELSSIQNNPKALLITAIIYLRGKYVKQDINKAIRYFTFAANQNEPFAQYILGVIYTNGLLVQRNINKAIYYFHQSNNENSRFILGVLYSKNEFIKRDIDKAIHYYKEASSLNNRYSKNNLAMIYKRGFKTKKNIIYSIELLNEAIKQRKTNKLNDVYFTNKNNKQNDFIPEYNLAHIYFYIESDFDKSIELLIKLVEDLKIAKELLALVLIKKLAKISLKLFEDEIQKYNQKVNANKLSSYIYEYIQSNKIDDENNYKRYLEVYREKDFMYDYNYKAVATSSFLNEKEENIHINSINYLFYEGFDLPIE
ncbi:hypothetical protein M9Y10_006845 [Tritrichomonas musculus]|uniref:Protein kinase domain-containing protein n=1 Tax=Tritrichomonas musculus TaxID=1915356 RepID=A0ABR2JFB8_9EUKA